MTQRQALPITTLIDPDNLNLAEYLDEEELTELGQRLRKALDIDLGSREAWETSVDEWMRLATQYKEEKSFPWPKAANIKYPLLTTAAMQFSARAYPSLIVNKKPVKGRIIGGENSQLTTISAKVAEHMNYQLMEEMEGWEDDMDKLFMILPIVGLAYKKTYYNAVKGMNVSELVLPKELVVNYWARKLTGYTRKHHLLEMSTNDIYTRKESGMFLDVELEEPTVTEYTGVHPDNSIMDLKLPSEDDETTPYRIVECHCHYDLDRDGYNEPYIVTFDSHSSKILRIVPRFREDSITWSDGSQKPKVLSILPDEYFTKYGFIPNPDGSFYDLGFGLLLGPINETINTSINQILDQGTMFTTNGGFLGKGIRIKAGDYKFSPNEWKVVNATTDDLRKSIFPLPVKEPSQTLFQLLGSLIEGGEKVASIAEIFVGKMPGQNTPATTTMETVKQGMAVFTAIYKRVYRSMEDEFKKLFRLNQLYLDSNIDHPTDLSIEDYQQIHLTVMPTADPDVATDSEKLIKARAQLEFIPLGTVDPKVVTRRVLEAMRVEGIEELMNYTPPPPPEAAQAQQEMQMQQQEAQIKQQDSEAKQFLMQMQASIKQFEAQIKAQAAQTEAQLSAMEKQMQIQAESMMAAIKQKQSVTEFQIAQRRGEEQHQQKLRHNEEAAKQKQKLAEVTARAKAKAPKKTK